MDNTSADTPGTLSKFHLGLAADGMSCAMVFIDDRARSIACLASFAELGGLIASLNRVAAELSRRRTQPAVSGDEEEPRQAPCNAINVAGSDFRMCADDGSILGSLVDDSGQVIGIRMRPEVANEMTRNMLLSAQAGSTC